MSLIVRHLFHHLRSKTILTSTRNKFSMAQQHYAYNEIRLPKDVIPEHYDLSLKPNLEDFTFSGDVDIHYGGTMKGSKTIVLNALNLVISEGSVCSDDDKIPLSCVIYNTKTETATLEFAKEVPSRGVIKLNFSGILNDKMTGFYKTTYKVDGVEVHAATTKFEPTHARKCYPCWDEPALKASYSVKLIFEKELNVNGKVYERVALSNMPEVSRSFNPTTRLTEVTFEKTPLVSTYLMAFIVGPFECLERHDGQRPVRVFSAPGKLEQGRLALDITCKALPMYDEYFDIKYSLGKMDLIAIPDFASGAMENWGLITYRESCLLFDPDNTATIRKQLIAIYITHELAHQWFGNLVTMEWWTHLWLNEGFASFMEYLFTDRIFPEYDIWSQFITDAYSHALCLDALSNSHPIEVPVNHPSEIGQIFDAISYQKGASIIRMLYHYLGDHDFRQGMIYYLKRYTFKNAATEGLWDSLECKSNKPVAKLMSCWTGQKGFPLLTVSLREEGTKSILQLSQRKFAADGKLSLEDTNALWVVPVRVMTDTGKITDSQLIDGRTGEIVLEGVAHKWVKVNPGLVDFYRTAYSADMAAKLLPAIQDRTLPAMDRLGMQSDLFALCQAGQASTVDLLKLLAAYKNEDDCAVWQSINESMIKLEQLLASTDSIHLLRRFGRDLYSQIFAKLGWESRKDEKHTVPITRASIITRLISLGHEGVVKEAIRRFQMRKDQPLPADLRSCVYRAVASGGDNQMFNDLIGIFRTSDLHEEKNRVLASLGFTEKSRLQQVIDFFLSDEVRSQDKIFAIPSIASTHPVESWQMFQDHHKVLVEKFGSIHMAARLIKLTTEHFASEPRAAEVERYFGVNKILGGERAIQQSIETIRLNAAWLNRDGEAIKSYLSQV